MRSILKMFLIVVLTLTVKADARAQDMDYKVASLYMYNFTKYIDWPNLEKRPNFVVGVFGNPKVKEDLAKAMSTRTMNGLPIVVKQFTYPEEALDCQMLLVTYPESGKIGLLQQSLKNKPVLIVTEKQGLLKKGAGINLFVDEEDSYKTKFEINKKSIELRNMKVASSLVKLSAGE